MIERLAPCFVSTFVSTFLSTAALAAALTLAPRAAEACGGTFCDNVPGPQVMPVDQTGENILFWIDRGGGEVHTEAHIQIQYEGDPERFAWIIPVSQVPEVLVGSQPLFDALLDATIPTFTVNSRFNDDCPSGGASVGFGCSDDSSAGALEDNGSFTTWGDTGGEEDTGVEILDRGFAGAFEYVTLTGGSVDEIVQWLDDNDYEQDEDAPPILQEYLDEDFVFVAIKLQSGTDVDEIHPLAIRYPGEEPCIPIRLTRIAAIEDMAIRAFFLGGDRVAPQNWSHVTLNWLALNWANGAAAWYNALVSAALDEAGGRGFVTEYAGTDQVVDTQELHSPLWQPSAFAEIEPINVVNELTGQGLMFCSDGICPFAHAQVEPLLRTYLPTPDGVDDEAFWSCLLCYEDDIDLVAWGQQPGFAADFEARISGPGLHAVDMLQDSTYLTRLFTLLSPHEMIEDPLFHETDSLPTVDNNVSVSRVISCDASPDYFEVGSQVVALDGNSWPRLDMPAAERLERIPMTGPPQVEADNAAAIEAAVKAWNSANLRGPTPGCSVARVRPEAVMTLMAIFGIAWLQRRRGRR